jgi:hypothetical protein
VSAAFISERPEAAGHAIAFGGPEAIRSMVKTALVLWSTLVGNDEMKRPYDSARSFASAGDEQFTLDRAHLDSRYLDDVEKMKAAYGPLFNLIYVRSDETGRVVGHFTLFNAMAWQFTLAESDGAPNTKMQINIDAANVEEHLKRVPHIAAKLKIPKRGGRRSPRTHRQVLHRGRFG